MQKYWQELEVTLPDASQTNGIPMVTNSNKAFCRCPETNWLYQELGGNLQLNVIDMSPIARSATSSHFQPPNIQFHVL